MESRCHEEGIGGAKTKGAQGNHIQRSAREGHDEVKDSLQEKAGFHPKERPHSGQLVGPVLKVVRHAGHVISSASKSRTILAASA